MPKPGIPIKLIGMIDGASSPEGAMTYKVLRARERIEPDACWGRPAWKRVTPLALAHWMGQLPAHRPATSARLLYDDVFLYVIFQVKDRHVRFTITDYQGPVCTDSCVELFFTPGGDIDAGYFNVETNCGGTVLFMHQRARGVDRIPIPASDAAALSVAHTMPSTAGPEIEGPLEWCVEYRIPLTVLAKFAPVDTPGPRVRWRANLYKCADRSSHPHWLTWAPVGVPRPDFHRPEFFGTLEFGE